MKNNMEITELKNTIIKALFCLGDHVIPGIKPGLSACKYMAQYMGYYTSSPPPQRL